MKPSSETPGLPESASPSRRRRWVVWLLLLTGAAGLIRWTFWGVPVPSSWARAALTSVADSAVAGRVSIGAVRWFFPLSFDIKQIQLKDAQGEELLRADSARAVVKWAGGRRFIPVHVFIDGLTIHNEGDSIGRFEKWLRSLPADTAGGAATWRIDEWHIHNFQYVGRLKGARDTVRVRRVVGGQWFGEGKAGRGSVRVMDMSWNGADVLADVRARLAWKGDDWWVEAGRAVGRGLFLRADVSRKSGYLHVTLDSLMLDRQPWWDRLAAVPFEALSGSGTFRLDDDTLQFEKVRMVVDHVSSLAGRGRIGAYREGWRRMHFQLPEVRLHIDRKHLARWFPTALPGGLSFIGYQGMLAGRWDDGRVRGTLYSPGGRAKVDAHVFQAQKAWHYQGEVALDASHIRRLWPDGPMKRLTARFNVKARGTHLDSLRAHLDGTILRAEAWPRGSIRDVRVRGELINRFFSGLIESRRPEADFTFNGIIDFTGEKVATASQWHIGLVDLKALQLSAQEATFGGNFRLSGQWADPDSFDFHLQGHSLFLASSEGGLVFDSLQGRFQSTHARKRLAFGSSAVQGRLEGRFQWAELWNVVKWWGYRYWNYPARLPDTAAIASPTYAQGRLVIQHPEVLLGLWRQSVHVSDSITVSFSLSRKNLVEHFYLAGGAVKYQGFQTQGLRIKYDGNRRMGTLMMRTRRMTSQKRLMFDEAHLTAAVSPFSSHWNMLALRNDGSIVLPLRGDLRWWGHDSLVASLTPLDWIIADSVWHFSSTPWRWRKTTGWQLGRVTLRSHASRLSFGQSDSIAGRYDVQMTRFPLGFIGRQVGGMLAESDGPISGQLTWQRNTGLVEGYLHVSPFLFTGDTIGPLYARLESDSFRRRTRMALQLGGPDGRPWVEAAGEITRLGDVPLTNIRARIRRVPFAVLRNYYAHLISDLEGDLDGYLLVDGRLDAPLVVGRLSGRRVGFTVNYLKTHYRLLDHTFRFDQHRFHIDSLTALDEFGHRAVVNGHLTYHYFARTRLDVMLRMDTFHVLNTTASDNQYFYGKAFASGIVSFEGPTDDIFMNADLRSEAGTDVFLPLIEEKPEHRYPFIQWTSAVPAQGKNQSQKAPSGSWFRYVMTTTLTPAARVRIIIDPATNEHVEGRGRGIITFGEPEANMPFFIRGRYEIESGHYYFTALDLFDRTFTIEPGGYILWMGDPYEARIHIVASYRLYAAIDDLMAGILMPEQYEAVRGQRYPVKVMVYLTGPLMKPDIRLDFQIETSSRAGSEAEQIFTSLAQRIKADPDELTRQVMSLLLFERFVPLQGGFSSAIDREAVYQNISSILSAQMNRLLNRLTSDIDYIDNLQLGVVYAPLQPAGPGQLSRRRVELALSTELFNERFFISGRYDFQNLLGNIEVSYRLTPNRTTRLRAFIQNQQSLWLGRYSQQGVGISFSKDFDTWQELLNLQRKK